jgi:hypothetical protein
MPAKGNTQAAANPMQKNRYANSLPTKKLRQESKDCPYMNNSHENDHTPV